MCKHDWVYSPEVIATNPPTYTKICCECGEVREECGRFVDADDFNRIKKRFNK